MTITYNMVYAARAAAHKSASESARTCSIAYDDMKAAIEAALKEQLNPSTDRCTKEQSCQSSSNQQ